MRCNILIKIIILCFSFISLFQNFAIASDSNLLEIYEVKKFDSPCGTIDLNKNYKLNFKDKFLLQKIKELLMDPIVISSKIETGYTLYTAAIVYKDSPYFCQEFIPLICEKHNLVAFLKTNSEIKEYNCKIELFKDSEKKAHLGFVYLIRGMTCIKVKDKALEKKLLLKFGTPFEYITGSGNITLATVLKKASPNTEEFFNAIIYEFKDPNLFVSFEKGNILQPQPSSKFLISGSSSGGIFLFESDKFILLQVNKENIKNELVKILTKSLQLKKELILKAYNLDFYKHITKELNNIGINLIPSQ